MRTFIAVMIGISALALPALVFAHGGEGGMMGGPSGEMSQRMMTLMHEHMDETASMDCSSMSGDTLMEHGEEMMEDMMGKEDHEKVEAVMSQEDHDAMHAMMGMIASGCVGDEAAASIAKHYSFSKGQPRTGSGGTFAIGLIAGAVLGVLGAGLFRKRPQAPAPPDPTKA